MEKNYQELLEEIRKLNEEYQHTIEGRKNIIKSIRKKIGAIREQTNAFNPELNELERYYSYRDYYISDYKLVLNLLLRLANRNEELYQMKEVQTNDFFQVGKDNKRLYSEVLFITDNEAMEKFGDHLYYYDEFANLATDLVDKGHSLIVTTKNMFEGNVKPKKQEVKCDSIFDIRNIGLIGNITCYINSPDLKESIDKLTRFIEANGPDFSNIDEDTLFNLMNEEKKYQKKLV